jgi:hypothetical protein
VLKPAHELNALCIYEELTATGQGLKTWLRLQEGALVLDNAHDAVVVPDGAIATIFSHYARPLAADVASQICQLPYLRVCSVASPLLKLHPLRHLARYDVIARDFLVLSQPEAEPLAELATTIAAALSHVLKLRPLPVGC